MADGASIVTGATVVKTQQGWDTVTERGIDIWGAVTPLVQVSVVIGIVIIFCVCALVFYKVKHMSYATRKTHNSGDSVPAEIFSQMIEEYSRQSTELAGAINSLSDNVVSFGEALHNKLLDTQLCPYDDPICKRYPDLKEQAWQRDVASGRVVDRRTRNREIGSSPSTRKTTPKQEDETDF